MILYNKYLERRRVVEFKCPENDSLLKELLSRMHRARWEVVEVLLVPLKWSISLPSHRPALICCKRSLARSFGLVWIESIHYNKLLSTTTATTPRAPLNKGSKMIDFNESKTRLDCDDWVEQADCLDATIRLGQQSIHFFIHSFFQLYRSVELGFLFILQIPIIVYLILLLNEMKASLWMKRIPQWPGPGVGQYSSSSISDALGSPDCIHGSRDRTDDSNMSTETWLPLDRGDMCEMIESVLLAETRLTCTGIVMRSKNTILEYNSQTRESEPTSFSTFISISISWLSHSSQQAQLSCLASRIH